MKKLAVVALALVIAMSFVGCGLFNQLLGTKWEQVQEDGSLFAEFKAKNVLIWSFEYNDLYDEDYESFSIEGTWSVEGNVLTMQVYDDEVWVYTYEIEGDTLKLTGDGFSAKLTRVK